MKVLLVCEYRQGKLLGSAFELLAFADRLGAERAMMMIGSEDAVPKFNGTFHLADVHKNGEYDPDVHKRLVLAAAEKEHADAIVFVHSSYGWDLAPRVAAALELAQVSEVVDIVEGGYVVPCFNAKLRRIVSSKTSRVVVTIQAGAFPGTVPANGSPHVEPLDLPAGTERVGLVRFTGYEAAQKKELDLGRADVIVSVGRGIGKKENISLAAALAEALGGELGATRPVVDAGWLGHSHQVGSTGQIVSPRLYIACGISGAIQHLAGMKKSEFIVAVNKDKEAPIGAVADVFAVADVMQLVPALTTRLKP